MCITVWYSLTFGPKREMKSHWKAISCNEQNFLWYLFNYYHTMAVQTVRTTLAKLNNLLTIMEAQCKINIDHFATCVITLLLCLAESGGSNTQAFDKVYEVLINSSCTVFNSEIMVYKQINASNLDVTS